MGPGEAVLSGAGFTGAGSFLGEVAGGLGGRFLGEVASFLRGEVAEGALLGKTFVLERGEA